MAEIHILPAGRDPVAMSKSYEALRQRFEAGADLGDRSGHIRMLSVSLEHAHQQLRHQIEAVRALPPVPGVDTEALSRLLETWAGALASCTTAIETHTSRA